MWVEAGMLLGGLWGRAEPPTGQRPLPLPSTSCWLLFFIVACCPSLSLSSNPNRTLVSHLIALGLNTFTFSSLPIIQGSWTNPMAHDS